MCACFEGAVIPLSLSCQAMRVHPDKHGGKERAGDAFKRLQNAFEVRVGRSGEEHLFRIMYVAVWMWASCIIFFLAWLGAEPVG